MSTAGENKFLALPWLTNMRDLTDALLGMKRHVVCSGTVVNDHISVWGVGNASKHGRSKHMARVQGRLHKINSTCPLSTRT